MSNAVNVASMSFALAVPSDSTVLRVATMRGLLVVSVGDLVLTNSAGVDVTLTGLPVGTFLPLKPQKIKVGTTADVLVLQ